MRNKICVRTKTSKLPTYNGWPKKSGPLLKYGVWYITFRKFKNSFKIIILTTHIPKNNIQALLNLLCSGCYHMIIPELFSHFRNFVYQKPYFNKGPLFLSTHCMLRCAENHRFLRVAAVFLKNDVLVIF